MLTFTAQTPPADPGNGLKQCTGILSDGTAAKQLDYAAGAFGQLLKHPHPVQNRVVAGEFEFTVGNDVFIVIAGESVTIPANTPSGCFCLVSGRLWEISA